MACSSGRPRLSDDQDRALFAESAGTCLLCCNTLFPEDPKRRRSVPIAERAHIISHSDHGPRADSSVSPADRDDPANLILLCPTCHTMVDKAPESYPAHDLKRQKCARIHAITAVGNSPICTTRSDARTQAVRLLTRTRLLFEEYGPSPEDGSMASIEAAQAWSEQVLDQIVPLNKLLIALIEVNRDLTTESDRRTAELLRQHTSDLERKHTEDTIIGFAKRFPVEAERLFCDGGNDEYRADF